MTALETDLVKAVVFRGRRVGYPLHRRGVSSSPIVTGHNAPHELVEQRHGESSIPVAGTPDHAFGDQLISGWSQRGNLPVKCFSDIPGTVWPGSELGHRSLCGTQESDRAASPAPTPDEVRAGAVLPRSGGSEHQATSTVPQPTNNPQCGSYLAEVRRKNSEAAMNRS